MAKGRRRADEGRQRVENWPKKDGQAAEIGGQNIDKHRLKQITTDMVNMKWTIVY